MFGLVVPGWRTSWAWSRPGTGTRAQRQKDKRVRRLIQGSVHTSNAFVTCDRRFQGRYTACPVCRRNQYSSPSVQASTRSLPTCREQQPPHSTGVHLHNLAWKQYTLNTRTGDHAIVRRPTSVTESLDSLLQLDGDRSVLDESLGYPESRVAVISS